MTPLLLQNHWCTQGHFWWRRKEYSNLWKCINWLLTKLRRIFNVVKDVRNSEGGMQRLIFSSFLKGFSLLSFVRLCRICILEVAGFQRNDFTDGGYNACLGPQMFTFHLSKTESDHFVFSKLAQHVFVSGQNVFCIVFMKGFKGTTPFMKGFKEQILLKLCLLFL